MIETWNQPRCIESRELPEAIDQLTPSGRVPDANESPQIARSTVRPN